MSDDGCECCGQPGLAQLIDERTLCNACWKKWRIKKDGIVREALRCFIDEERLANGI